MLINITHVEFTLNNFAVVCKLVYNLRCADKSLFVQRKGTVLGHVTIIGRY